MVRWSLLGLGNVSSRVPCARHWDWCHPKFCLFKSEPKVHSRKASQMQKIRAYLFISFYKYEGLQAEMNGMHIVTRAGRPHKWHQWVATRVCAGYLMVALLQSSTLRHRGIRSLSWLFFFFFVKVINSHRKYLDSPLLPLFLSLPEQNQVSALISISKLPGYNLWDQEYSWAEYR